MKVVGANTNSHAEALEELPTKHHYFIGNDPSKWRTGTDAYAKVKYHDVYPGVDLVYYGHQRQLEYDFVVAPGTDPGMVVNALQASYGGGSIDGFVLVLNASGSSAFFSTYIGTCPSKISYSSSLKSLRVVIFSTPRQLTPLSAHRGISVITQGDHSKGVERDDLVTQFKKRKKKCPSVFLVREIFV